MKISIVSFLVCALILSTFADGDSKEKSKDDKGSKENSHESDENDSKCSKEDSSEEHGGDSGERGGSVNISIKLNHQQSLDLHYIYNRERKIVLVIDIVNRLSAIFDGVSGSVHLFYYQSSHYFYISGGLWYAEKIQLDEYFRDIKSLLYLVDLGRTQGEYYQAQYLTTRAAKRISVSLSSLSTTYRSKYNAFSIMIALGNGASYAFSTSLKGFESVISDELEIPSRGDLEYISAFYHGMSVFFGYFGGAQVLVEKKITFKLSEIITQETGFHVLGKFLTLLNGKLDLGSSLSKYVNNQFYFFTLINNFCGNRLVGYDGFIKTITYVVNYNYKYVSEATLRIFFRHYFKRRDTKIDIAKQWKANIEYIQSVIVKLQLNSSFKDLDNLLTAIIKGEWIYQEVNMSEIVDLIIKCDGKDKSIDDIIRRITKKKKNGSDENKS